MTQCTFYDLLGVSSHATKQEIINAKNFLIKRLHPDATMDDSFDTTRYIQKILEAYHVLSDSHSRELYDKRTAGAIRRHTYTDFQEQTPAASFVPYWEAANKLNELVEESITLFSKQQRAQKSFLSNHFLHQSEKAEKRLQESKFCEEELISLAHLAIPHMDLLKEASVPEKYWFSDAMNWLLLKWSQNRDLDFHLLFPMYDVCMQTYKSEGEQNKINAKNKHFLSCMNQLIDKKL